MVHRAVIHGVVLKGLWPTSVNRTSFRQQNYQTPILRSRCECKIITNIKDFCSERRIDLNRRFNCLNNENISSSSSMVSENTQEPPQETDLEIISDRSHRSRTKGRAGQTTNIIFGDTVIDGSSGEWLTLSQKLDTYPSVRRFTAIGIGGNDFVQSMILAVESVIQHPVQQLPMSLLIWLYNFDSSYNNHKKLIQQEHVKQRVSSGGKYVSVSIGPIQVVSREHVQFFYFCIYFLVETHTKLQILITRDRMNLLESMQVRAINSKTTKYETMENGCHI
uniref:Uncharacterized protein n=1 Tax=Lactuca sativa TaxID=4236 RepID=A0A9R1VWS8_LACSA|nr:hypothetical protein LSAT_V11C400178870 [Lactuca sativa]